jgi:hypothetical protein
MAGSEWVDCIPLDMVNYQYIDCRDHQYRDGLANIVQMLSGIFVKPFVIPDGLFAIDLGADKTVTVNPAQYSDLQDFLDNLYLDHLQWKYDVFTYGSAWVLVNSKTQRVAVPWTWLFHAHKDLPLNQFDRKWGNAPLADYSFVPGSRWELRNGSISAVGFAVGSFEVFNKLRSPDSTEEAWQLYQNGSLKMLPPEDVDLLNRYSIILAMSKLGFRTAYVET